MKTPDRRAAMIAGQFAGIQFGPPYLWPWQAGSGNMARFRVAAGASRVRFCGNHFGGNHFWRFA
jgi:hypothetical protein